MTGSGWLERSGRFAVLALAALATLSVAGCGGGTSIGVVPLISGTYATFQSASVVIGQPDFQQHQINQNGTSTPAAETLHNPAAGALLAAGALYVPDTGNNRVLGFNSLPTMNDQPADFAVGQPDFSTSTTPNPPTARSLSAPMALASHNGDLVVADSGNNRVLIWDSAPAGDSDASVVLGQSDFQTRTAPPAGSCTQDSLNDPQGVAVTPQGQLVVADTGDNRVLIWNSLPTANGTPPDLVLGQPDMATGDCSVNQGSGPGAGTLRAPTAVWTDGTRLVVADSGNNRVLVWNTFPTQDDQPADLVLGQGDFSHAAANDDAQTGTAQPTPTARTLDDPRGVYSDGTRLFVADTGNNRVLVWNAFPSASFAPADVVLGQGDFTHNTPNDDNQDGQQDASASARTLNGPEGVMETGKKLLVSDSANNRALIYQGQ